VDIRHEPQPIDVNFMEWLGENQIPFCIIFTKADKLKPAVIERQVADYLGKLEAGAWEEAPQHFVTSSSHRTGRETLLDFIDQVNTSVKG